MTHGVFPIEMLRSVIVEIILVLETKLQSYQVLTNKLKELKMGSLSAGISFRLVYCDSLVKTLSMSMWVPTLYGNGLTGTFELMAVTVCSPIERSKLIVSAKSCSPLRRVWVSTSGRLTLARGLAKALMEDWWTRSISCLSCSSLRAEPKLEWQLLVVSLIQNELVMHHMESA